MRTIRVAITPAEVAELEEKLLILSNELGRPLGFSIEKMERRSLSLVGYFKTKKMATDELRLLGLDKRVTHGFLKDRDWQLCMRNHFEPLYYRGVAWVPTWSKSTKKAGTILKFDPEMAFGSGNHPTTRLCLKRLVELLEKYRGQELPPPTPALRAGKYIGGSAPITPMSLEIPVASASTTPEGLPLYSPTLRCSLGGANKGYGCIPTRGKRPTLLDIGCGSGILGITADRLGAKAIGIDYDPEAIIVSRRNAKLNHSKALFKIGDVYKDNIPSSDIVVANLLGNIITDNAQKLWNCVNPGGTLILSGLLKEELEKIAALFPSPSRLCRLGNWGAVVVRKDSRI
jgi:ribosomal protein L11 methylase PrmA